MSIRVAQPADIEAMFVVRMSVKENVLVNTNLVTNEICEDYITRRGKGWVYELNGIIAGFAIADIAEDSIWALFVKPEFEGLRIGYQLHRTMLDWYFSNDKEKVWLTTAPDTRAEKFYRRAGWNATGISHGEIRFELTAAEWRQNYSSQ